MKKIFQLPFLVVILLFAISCKKDLPVKTQNLEGYYEGIFQRIDSLKEGSRSNVKITFTNDGFSGSSENNKYPAICSGTYTKSGNTIHFINNCMYTADFDWTLILSGEYDYSLLEKKLTLTRKRGNQIDQYILTKK